MEESNPCSTALVRGVVLHQNARVTGSSGVGLSRSGMAPIDRDSVVQVATPVVF
jgi:hypothetical protein